MTDRVRTELLREGKFRCDSCIHAWACKRWYEHSEQKTVDIPLEEVCGQCDQWVKFAAWEGIAIKLGEPAYGVRLTHAPKWLKEQGQGTRYSCAVWPLKKGHDHKNRCRPGKDSYLGPDKNRRERDRGREERQSS